MNKIYLVEGSTGEYADQCHWIVKAFCSEIDAEKFVEACQKETDRLEKVPYHHYDKRRYEKHSLDPFYRRDYNGVSYCCFEMELVE